MWMYSATAAELANAVDVGMNLRLVLAQGMRWIWLSPVVAHYLIPRGKNAEKKAAFLKQEHIELYPADVSATCHWLWQYWHIMAKLFLGCLAVLFILFFARSFQ